MDKRAMKLNVPMIVCGVLAAVALGAWIYQQMGGLAVTGMSNATSWGLYITCFMFFVGLSAGGLIVASSASVFHVEKFKQVALPAVLLSTVCICLAGAFVLIDLGGIARIWRMFTGLNLMSPLAWDMIVICIYLAINIVYLYFMCSKKADKSKIAVVSRFALPVAILVHSVTAWIFGLEIGREGWYSAIMAPLFVVSAMDSGLALLLLALLGLDRKKLFETDKKLIGTLAGLMVTCVAIDGYLVGCELLTAAYPQGDALQNIVGVMLGGATAPAFWIEVVLGIVVPFCILVFAKNRANMKLVAFSSACIVIGVFCKRIWLLFTSFVVPNVGGAPGLSLGTSAAQSGTEMSVWALAGTYAPTAVEVLVVIGTIAFGALAFMVLAQKLLPAGRETR